MSQITFTDRVVAITGAGRGLGREHALDLARRGAAVVVNDLGGTGAGSGSSTSAADEVVAEIRAAGGRAVANYDSVSTRAGGRAVTECAMDSFGRLDAVVNNAGFLRNKVFEDLEDAELDDIVDVHLKAAFYVTQPAYRVMQSQGYGRIVFTSSASGAFGSPEQTNYGAAKAGLLGLTNCLAWEGHRHGVLVNAVLPTAAGTRLTKEMSQEWFDEMVGPLPLDTGILAPAQDPSYVTPLVVYLASEQNTATRGFYSATGGRFAKVVTAVTHGWFGPLERPATAEEIAGHFTEIESDEQGYYLPQSVIDESRPVLAHRLQQPGPASVGA
ncbi:SDR family NAD(P)-dependent oxidoreductase [Streptomyces fuscichromogenes]|uniref:SDR family NAD(P)-dependent oxidoreductase n=1 Tax=Streptomyces fuscichromogenes TaxID=1324013 RepID=UPI00382DF038